MFEKYKLQNIKIKTSCVDCDKVFDVTTEDGINAAIDHNCEDTEED
jgi:hypothetical protein